MLGLQALEKLKGVDHGTTIEKAAFILEYLGESHKLTTLVSFVAIVVLVGARLLKPRLSKWAKWVVYLPEVLLVVVVATGRDRRSALCCQRIRCSKDL
jgi:MFS superfamily sulfate permease-like transporter